MQSTTSPLRPLTADEARAELALTLVLPQDRFATAHRFGATEFERVARWTRRRGFRISLVDSQTRRVHVYGETAALASAFGVSLQRFSGTDATGRTVVFRGHSGAVELPAELCGAVDGVFGLDDRPLARPHLRAASAPALVSYDPGELADVYAFPRLRNGGAGMHLVAGMIELGGIARARDIAAAFARMKLPAPQLINVSVDTALPRADPDGADVEVALDYQVLGGIVLQMAPRARLTIVVYNAPNHERGFIDAVATAATDRLHRPAAVSISWGAPENAWTSQAMRAMNAAFAVGASRGVAFSASAGDWGSSNAEPDGLQHAEHPASSPHVWACGGTTLLASRGRVMSETVWNGLGTQQGAAGSGVSSFFRSPAYQTLNGIEPRSANDGRIGRGLPDASGNADPLTGWNVLVGGTLRTTGGTSAVAPMYAALWTLVGALTQRRVGSPHDVLYRAGARCFRDVTRGDTGGPYRARAGWDAASGWGSPIGTRIAHQLGRGITGGRPARGRRRDAGDRSLHLM